MSIRIATEADFREAAEVLASPYVDDEQDAYMFPNRLKYWDRYLKTKESIIRHGAEDPTGTVSVAVEKDEAGKQTIAGVCIWYKDEDDEEGDEQENNKSLWRRLKSSEPMQYLQDLFDPLVSASNAATMARYCRSPSSKVLFSKERPVDKNGCMGIMDIAVHKDFQRRGLARKLVEWGMQKGLPVELSATPAGEGLYASLGFEVVGVWRWREGMEGDDGLGGWKVMRWEPRG